MHQSNRGFSQWPVRLSCGNGWHCRGEALDLSQAMSETRILIADDHAVVRSGLRALLEAQPGWTVVAEACDGREALAKTLETAPDVAIIDYSLPQLNGAEVTRQIQARLPSVEVLIFTMHDSDSLLADILAAGARAYLLKSDANQYLIAAVASLAEHKPFFTGKVSEQLLDSYLSAHQGRPDGLLSARERAVVQLIAEGKSNKEMSEALGLSIKTIESHRASLMRKLKLKSTAAIVRYAIRNRLVEP